ncbi:MAG: SH3 domain-containing protein [Alphaproteobacteria bacterium]|nr:SH3 domain-containing protein [Alphaproteobacteria bacterium]
MGMNYQGRLPVILFSALTAIGFAQPAAATEFCQIAKTRDGFVALRAAPDTSAKILARMRPGDEAQLSGDPKGQWQRVIYWKGEERLTRGYDKHTATGWVNRGLLRDCG